MRVARLAALLTAGLWTGLLAGLGPATAQSLTPMRGEITSYTDEFALKVYPRNPYKHTIQVDIRAYDQDFRPTEAMIWPASFKLPAGGARPVTVVIDFKGQQERRVRVCVESIPYVAVQSQIKAQICGKFLARRSG